MIYKTQNLLSLYLVSFLVGLRTYQHPCIRVIVSFCKQDSEVVYVLWGISPATDCGLRTFRNPLSVPLSKAGCGV